MKCNSVTAAMTFTIARALSACTTTPRAAAPVQKVHDAAQEPAIGSKAAEILSRMCTTLQKSKAFRFHVVITFDEVLESGLKLQQWGTIDVAIRRPDGIRVERKTDVQHRRLVYDGKAMNVLDVGKNMYGSTPAPGTIDAALDDVAQRFGVTVPFADLMFSDPYAVLTQDIIAGSYVGVSTFRGVSYDHLVFSHADLDWQVWLRQDERALPVKFLITYAERPSHPQYGGVFTEWDLTPRFEGGEFAFIPPEAAERIELLPEEPEGEG